MGRGSIKRHPKHTIGESQSCQGETINNSDILPADRMPANSRKITESEQAMNCPHCGKPINPAALLGSMTSPAKAAASRANAKLGGWPKGKKRGKKKRVARGANISSSATREM